MTDYTHNGRFEMRASSRWVEGEPWRFWSPRPIGSPFVVDPLGYPVIKRRPEQHVVYCVDLQDEWHVGERIRLERQQSTLVGQLRQELQAQQAASQQLDAKIVEAYERELRTEQRSVGRLYKVRIDGVVFEWAGIEAALRRESKRRWAERQRAQKLPIQIDCLDDHEG